MRPPRFLVKAAVILAVLAISGYVVSTHIPIVWDDSGANESLEEDTFVLTAEAMTAQEVVANATVDPGEDRRAIVETAIRNGTAVSLGERAFTNGTYLRHDGAFYLVIAKRATNPDVENRSTGEVAWPADEVPANAFGYDASTESFYRATGDEPVAGDEPSEYTYTAKQVGTTRAAFLDHLVNEIRAGDLDEEERTILRRAINGGYNISSAEENEAFTDVLIAVGLPGRQAMSVGHYTGATEYIRYQGTYYEVSFCRSETMLMVRQC